MSAQAPEQIDARTPADYLEVITKALVVKEPVPAHEECMARLEARRR